MANTAIVLSSGTPTPAQMPVNPFLSVCALPGVMGGTLSDNITQTMDLNSQILFMPFYVTKDYTTTGFKINVETGLAASTATLGVWAANSNYLASGAPLGSVQYNTATTGEKSQALVISFTANVIYWVGIQLSSAVTQSIVVCSQNFAGGSPANEFLGGSSYKPSCFNLTNTYTAGVMPTINPASLDAVGYGYAPFILFD